MGAVIKIREAVPDPHGAVRHRHRRPDRRLRRAGAAAVLGHALLERACRCPPTWHGYSLGEPLLFQLATWLKFGHIPDGYSVNIHPVVFAAWFGMLATAWNLLPFGQLDGGHLTYATLGDRSRYFSLRHGRAARSSCASSPTAG